MIHGSFEGVPPAFMYHSTERSYLQIMNSRVYHEPKGERSTASLKGTESHPAFHLRRFAILMIHYSIERWPALLRIALLDWKNCPAACGGTAKGDGCLSASRLRRGSLAVRDGMWTNIGLRLVGEVRYVR